ncbi:unnamed protein product, partial [marine sediment metagenome]
LCSIILMLKKKSPNTVPIRNIAKYDKIVNDSIGWYKIWNKTP